MDSSKEMPIDLVSYDPTWPDRFESERRAIASVMGADLVAIEHFGSIAIPGLRAKPILEIMVLIPAIETEPRHFEALRALDDHYFPYGEDEAPERRWFCKKEMEELASA